MFAGMADRVRSFVEGSDHIALIVQSPATDSLPLLKIIEEVETSSAADLFWTFTADFVEARSWAAAVISDFAARHEAMCEAMAAAGMVPWPAIPPHVRNEASAPAARLRDLAAFSRELLPVPNGGNNVWVFYPLVVVDMAGYATLMAQVLEHEYPFPWCHHLRFVVRDEPVPTMLQQRLAGRPRIDWWRPDLSLEVVNAAVAQQVADPSLSLDARMSALLIAAGNDFGLQQYPAALQKFELLLRYHAPLGNLAMAALALNGIGEVYSRLGHLEHASAAFQAALIPASDGEPPALPVLLNVVMNMANLRMTQERWEEAEGYWDSAQQLAAAARNAPLRIEALEQRGVCEERQGRHEAAEKSWNDGCIMAGRIEDATLCERLLVRLEALFHRTGRQSEAWGVSRMLTDLRA